ncbi:hypothetical protein HDU96_010420 [Phlyctochytrium bullatum]|nr:hypothetical protein HDU96_010420 [Phlyctochytrium bullatum]
MGIIERCKGAIAIVLVTTALLASPGHLVDGAPSRVKLVDLRIRDDSVGPSDISSGSSGPLANIAELSRDDERIQQDIEGGMIRLDMEENAPRVDEREVLRSIHPHDDDEDTRSGLGIVDEWAVSTDERSIRLDMEQNAPRVDERELIRSRYMQGHDENMRSDIRAVDESAANTDENEEFELGEEDERHVDTTDTIGIKQFNRVMQAAINLQNTASDRGTGGFVPIGLCSTNVGLSNANLAVVDSPDRSRVVQAYLYRSLSDCRNRRLYVARVRSDKGFVTFGGRNGVRVFAIRVVFVPASPPPVVVAPRLPASQENPAILTVQNSRENLGATSELPADGTCVTAGLGRVGVDVAAVDSPRANSIAVAILYSSIDDCRAKRNRIGLFSSSDNFIPIPPRGTGIDVKAARVEFLQPGQQPPKAEFANAPPPPAPNSTVQRPPPTPTAPPPAANDNNKPAVLTVQNSRENLGATSELPADGTCVTAGLGRVGVDVAAVDSPRANSIAVAILYSSIDDCRAKRNRIGRFSSSDNFISIPPRGTGIDVKAARVEFLEPGQQPPKAEFSTAPASPPPSSPPPPPNNPPPAGDADNDEIGVISFEDRPNNSGNAGAVKSGCNAIGSRATHVALDAKSDVLRANGPGSALLATLYPTMADCQARTNGIRTLSSADGSVAIVADQTLVTVQAVGVRIVKPGGGSRRWQAGVGKAMARWGLAGEVELEKK